MIPMIVNGEIKKLENTPAHQAVFDATFTWNGHPRDVSYRVSYWPVNRHLFEVTRPASATGTAVAVDLQSLTYRDPVAGYWEHFELPGPRTDDQFRNSRTVTYQRTLAENEVTIEGAEGAMEHCYLIETVPRSQALWETHSTSFVDRKTKHLLLVEERDRNGELLNAFEQVSKELVAKPTQAFHLQAQPDWRTVEVDFRAAAGQKSIPLARASHAPLELAGMPLVTATKAGEIHLFDYSRDGIILAAAEIPCEGPRALNPLARQVSVKGLDAYVSYVGSLTTLVTYVDGRRIVLFSNTGPGPMLEWVDAALLPRVARAERAADQDPEQPADPMR